jgi:pyruvate dehydrogenase (quinone)
VERPEDIGGAWDEALAAGRPCVLEVVTDPDVPPLPPHIKFSQAKAFATALWKGDADAMGMIRRAIGEVRAGSSSKSTS